MKLLLHACCAPCAIIPIEELAADNDLTLYWYNPNIHPAMEYMQRREALDVLAEKRGLPVIDERVYDMARFLEKVAEDPFARLETGAYEIYEKTRTGKTTAETGAYEIHEKTRTGKTTATAETGAYDSAIPAYYARKERRSGIHEKTRKGSPVRCGTCYRMRLDKAARTASENGFEAFTTTLFYSPYQDREMILKAGREAGDAAGVMFAEYDWTGRYREGQDLAREMDLYRQKYCGCIYSEKERYGKKLKKYVDQP